VLTPEAKKALPQGRGDLLLVFAADRAQLNRRGVVTFMLDARLERPMDEVAQARAEDDANNPVSLGGDLMLDGQTDIATLRLELQPKGGAPRALRFAKDRVPITPGTVYEMPLAGITEADGTAARLVPGDILLLETAVAGEAAVVKLWNSEHNTAKCIDLLPPDKKPVARSLRFVLTDDPVIEPPPALYAALLRTETTRGSNDWQVAAPLHAQSPLPRRVDLVEPARDFRRGMMRRHASFVWTLTRPRSDFAERSLYVIKSDRNGQTYLPVVDDEFLTPERLAK
jgi:hypothetical protein